MKKKSKILGVVALGVLGLLCLAWAIYTPPSLEGQTMEIKKEITLRKATKEMLGKYAKQQNHLLVPPWKRVKDIQIISMTPLKEKGYIEVHYVVKKWWNRKEKQQGVFKFRQQNRTLRLEKVMMPVQYQIQYEGVSKEEPSKKEYGFHPGEKNSYSIHDQELYVTYDGGKTPHVVPDGYRLVCQRNGNEDSQDLYWGSYVIEETFTGFVGFDKEGAVLLYSLDQGATWKKSVIEEKAFFDRCFLNKVEKGCVVTVPVDRAAGSTYYGTYYSQDYTTFKSIPLPQTAMSRLTCVFFESGNIGYVGKDDMLMYTKDQGKTYVEISLPEAKEIEEQLGYQPFIEPMYMEKKGQEYLLWIGQGPDGDYAKEGHVLMGLFQSTDGVHFQFKEEVKEPDFTLG